MMNWDLPGWFNGPTLRHAPANRCRPRPCDCEPPCPPPPPRPQPCGEELSVRVLGTDHCGNLIISVKRPRYCEVNGDWVPCRRFK